jgi:hypothetical protein
MLKMNAACIIQCAAIGRHLFNAGGRIGGNESRVRLDEVPSCGGFGHLLRRPERQSTRLRLQQQLLRQFVWALSALAILRARAREAHCGMTAALAFRSITAGPARTTAAWRAGIDPASYRWPSFVAARLPEACAFACRSVRAESPLRCIWIQSYAFGSANLHDQSLRVLRRGARANHSSRVGEVVEWLL